MRGFTMALAALLVQCGGDKHARVPYAVVSPPRDWTAHPAIVQVDTTSPIYAMSDVHGGYDRMVALLVGAKLIVAPPAKPEDARWTGGDAVLVVVGDLIDKGPAPLEAIDLLRALEPQGRVLVTLGNHEAEFLDDPENDKATKEQGVDDEIHARGLSPVDIANGSDPRGRWLRDRPFGARVGAWFFAHGGNTKGRRIAELESTFENAIAMHDYDDAEIIGGDSILEAREWYTADPTTSARYAAAVGARHIVFGHDPNAIGPRGAIAVAYDGALFRIDCGMSPTVNDSDGRMLRIRQDGATTIAESLTPDGAATEIWRGP